MKRYERVGQCDLYQGDCLSVMPWLPSGSVDMILCDLPYGTTACKWDTVIPFEPLWAEYKRIVKPNGAIVLFGSEPFSSGLRLSNVGWFKHDWIWDKKKPGSCVNAKVGPLKQHEIVSVFCGGKLSYNPIMVPRDIVKKRGSYTSGATIALKHDGVDREYSEKYPKSILTEFSNASQRDRLHPTQKPVALCEYLIKTYTNEGETVLDNCAGSFTTGVAALNTNRKFIGIEQDSGYFDIGVERMKVRMAEVVLTQNPLFSYGMTGRDTQDSKSDSPLLA